MKTREIIWKRASIINEDIVNEVESVFNIELPDDVKRVFLYANNGRPSPSTFDSVSAREHVLKKLLSFKKKDIENVYLAKTALDKVDKSLFPLANDPFGNLICLKGNKIVYWNHETDEIELLASSFTIFLNSLY